MSTEVEEMVYVSRKELDALLNIKDLFEALQDQGVENWEGYELALEELDKQTHW